MTETIKPETIKSETIKSEKSDGRLSWSDLESIKSERLEDSGVLFSSDPETDKTWRSNRIEIDPETVSLFLSYCSKVNRIQKRSDKRLKGLRSDLSVYLENVT